MPLGATKRTLEDVHVIIHHQQRPRGSEYAKSSFFCITLNLVQLLLQRGRIYKQRRTPAIPGDNCKTHIQQALQPPWRSPRCSGA